MKRQDFYFDLPEELIAQDPLEDRSSSRLLVLDKKTGATSHHIFREIKDYLKPGDCLVINDTKVIPARLIGEKEGTGGKVEVLLLKRKGNDVWETLVKPGKKMKPGARVSFGDGLLKGEVLEVVEEGNRLIHFEYEGIFEEILDQLGQMPLPPYITHQLEDKNRYQTVYAKHSGSAAAPTAGLHFTPELLEEIKAEGVEIAHVTLHVGLGTFRPVKADDILDHHMHSEFYRIEASEAEKINRAKESGHRVICVGTTSCRTVESAADENGKLKECSGWTEIFIYPGYKFKVLDCLITNFHLPESTLIMLVSALAGREHVLAAYEEAVKERYRFFSFGDVMRIMELYRNVGNESHHFREFARFQSLDGRVYVSHLEPKSDVIMLVGRHFADRMPSEYWMIVDDNRKTVCVHLKDGENYLRYLTDGEFEALRKTEEYEDEYTGMWKTFFHTIRIKERENYVCQRNLFPIWKRKHAVEFKE